MTSRGERSAAAASSVLSAFVRYLGLVAVLGACGRSYGWGARGPGGEGGRLARVRGTIAVQVRVPNGALR